MEEQKKKQRKNQTDMEKQEQCMFSLYNTGNKDGELSIITSATSLTQTMGQRKRARRRSIYSYKKYDYKAEDILKLPTSIQNMLKDRRAERREREKNFKQLMASVAKYIETFKLTRDELIVAIDQNKISDWKALSILVDSLGHPLGSILTDVYHEVWASEPFGFMLLSLNLNG